MTQGGGPTDLTPLTPEAAGVETKQVEQQGDPQETRPFPDSEETEGARWHPEGEMFRPADPLLGGRYVIQQQIGRGGLGDVYSAMDKNLNRVIALKVPRPYIHNEYNDVVFQAARLVARIQHERIARIYDVYADAVPPFIVMEKVAGSTLGSRMSVREVPMHEIVYLATQIAEGLAEMHANGVIHRDLKPETVMLMPYGGIKLIGLGIAIDVRTAAKPDDCIAGTPGYMAPEQIRGHAFDERVDVFALGVIIYELVTGGPCFDAYTASERIMATLHQEPDFSNRAWRRVPKRLREHTARMLSQEPAGRFANGADVLAALRELTPNARRLDLTTTPAILQSTRISHYPQTPLVGAHQLPGARLRNRIIGWGIALGLGALIGNLNAPVGRFLYDWAKKPYIIFLILTIAGLWISARLTRSPKRKKRTSSLMAVSANFSRADAIHGIMTTLDIGATHSRSIALDDYTGDVDAIRDDWMNVAQDVNVAIRAVISSETET